MPPSTTRLPAALALLLPLGCGSGGGPDSTPAAYPRDGELRVDQVQCEGTHNSYHVAPDPVLSSAWSYSHLPLHDQLDLAGVRQVELDVWFEPSDPPHFEVYHFPLLDEDSTCRLLADCLAELSRWSAGHPNHQPIFVQLEPKDEFDEALADAWVETLEAALREGLGVGDILTPDELRGDAPTVLDAVSSRGWPTLGQARGRFVLFLDETGPWRSFYTWGDHDLRQRLIFVDGAGGMTYGALRVLNDPVDNGAEIAEALALNQVVRTRADTDSEEPLAGDYGRQQAALASGAHVISTDYPAPVEGVPYWLDIPGGTPSRCNPVTGPDDCAPEDIEDPQTLTGVEEPLAGG